MRRLVPPPPARAGGTAEARGGRLETPGGGEGAVGRVQQAEKDRREGGADARRLAKGKQRCGALALALALSLSLSSRCDPCGALFFLHCCCYRRRALSFLWHVCRLAACTSTAVRSTNSQYVKRAVAEFTSCVEPRTQHTHEPSFTTAVRL